MRERELLERIELAARSAFHASAAAAVEGSAIAVATARAASLVFRIAAFLRPLPVRHRGNFRILRARVVRLLELLEDGAEARELGALAALLEADDVELVAEAFDRKVG